MRNLITLFFILGIFATVSGQSNSIHEFHQKFKDHSYYFDINIEGGILKFLADTESDDDDPENLIKVLSGIDAINIQSINRDESNFDDGDLKEFIRKIRKDKFEDLMIVDEKDSKINFMIKEAGGKVSDLILLINNDEEFTVVCIRGNIDLNTIAKLNDCMDFKGMEHLDQLGVD